MQSAKIVKFPSYSELGNKRARLILCAVSEEQDERITCEYKQNCDGWVFDLRSSTIDGMISALIRCKDLQCEGKVAEEQRG